MNIGTCSILRFQFPIWNFRKPLISTRFNMRLLSVRNSSASSIATTTTEPTNSKKNEPWLIVGLGNPGKKYAATRHNVGFEMVDAIAEAEGISMSTVSFKALFGKGFIGDVPVLLAKPQTFMNASGESVGAIVSYYKIPLKQIFDDMIFCFSCRMKSVINHLKGNSGFPCLRIWYWTTTRKNGSYLIRSTINSLNRKGKN
ncbi:unnamed protein product [Vicia faba]|uniref:peptidyl-tRNA hydrolase n=1 Tax=Vicia faba TaxID=3906 RepID=A0AAV1BBH5_VICFA|nr:unnamed protein product [Vicia faba]